MFRRSKIFGEQCSHNIANLDLPRRGLENCWTIDGWLKLIAPDLRNRPNA